MQKFNLPVGKYFLKRVPDDSVYTMLAKILSNLLYVTPLPWCVFTQNVKMAANNGGKTIAGKKWQISLRTPCGPKILSKLLYLAPFPR